MIVVSHSSSRGLLIFVAYLEKGKVLLGLKFLKCVCIHVGLLYVTLHGKMDKNILRFSPS